MPLLTLRNARLAFGHHRLLDGAEFQLDPRERVGLIGRNGTGKSSLLKVIAGLADLDDGELWLAPGARDRVRRAGARPRRRQHRLRRRDARAGRAGPAARRLPSRSGAPRRGRTRSAPARRRRHAARPARRGRRLGARPPRRRRAVALRAAAPTRSSARCRAAAASASRWRRGWRPSPTCCCSTSRPITSTSAPSRGSKRCCRTSPARSSASPTTGASSTPSPPASSSWTAAGCASTRATSPPTRSARRDESADEAVANAKFDKVLAQEEVWIRKGIEARRTRNEGRVRRLEAAAARARGAARAPGHVNLRVDDGARSGQMVAELTACDQGLRRPGADPRLHHAHPARRPHRADRPQRRRQDHAAQADPRASSRRTPARCAAAPTSPSPTSTSCARSSTPTPPCRTPSAPAPTGSRSAASAAT